MGKCWIKETQQTSIIMHFKDIVFDSLAWD